MREKYLGTNQGGPPISIEGSRSLKSCIYKIKNQRIRHKIVAIPLKSVIHAFHANPHFRKH